MISCIHLLSYIVNLIIQQINNMTDRELNQNQETDRLKVKSIENNTAKNRIHRSSISLELRAETKNEYSKMSTKVSAIYHVNLIPEIST